MLSKVLSFLLHYSQVVFPVCGGAIAYLSVYKKRPIKTRFLTLPILVVITFLLSLIDNPFSDRTYSGLLFAFYNVYVLLLKCCLQYHITFQKYLSLQIVSYTASYCSRNQRLFNDLFITLKLYLILWGTFYFIDTILCIFHFNCDKYSRSICGW